MEYTNIIAAVPTGEHFDASAINEGVWMSQAHLNSIESNMAAAATNVAASLNEVSAATENINAANAATEAATATIAERDATIAAQAAEITTLKSLPAATIKEASKDGDDFGDGSVVVQSEVTKEANRLRALRDGTNK